MGTHSYREPADTFVESKSNSKICTYIKTYFSLHDLSLQFRSGQSRARWGGVQITFQVGVSAAGFVSAAG
jgi:hypothetical protein